MSYILCKIVCSQQTHAQVGYKEPVTFPPFAPSKKGLKAFQFFNNVDAVDMYMLPTNHDIAHFMKKGKGVSSSVKH